MLDLIKMTIYIFISAILMLYIVFELLIPDQTIKVIGYKPYIVLTQSMEPKIDANDLVIVKDINVDELEVGDIITFNADIDYDGHKEVVTHYIYSIHKNQEGDLSFKTNRYYEDKQAIVPDTWVLLEEDLLGTYLFHVPMIGSVLLFLKSPFGIAAMIVNISIIAAIIALLRRDQK